MVDILSLDHPANVHVHLNYHHTTRTIHSLIIMFKIGIGVLKGVIVV